MPQKEMRIIPKPAGEAIVLEPEAGKLALEGTNGDTTYRCGACKTRLMDKADKVLNDPRIGQLFLGGAMEETAA